MYLEGFIIKYELYPEQLVQCIYDVLEEKKSYSETINAYLSDEDDQVWRSSNPVGATMDFNTLGDTATVMTSEFDNKELFWTFTTVFSLDHFGHPVSGHRQFGLAKNANGNFTFYLRGTDRLATRFMQIVNNMGPSDSGEAAFELAGKSWEILMLNLEKFIRDRNDETIKFDRTKEYGR